MKTHKQHLTDLVAARKAEREAIDKLDSLSNWREARGVLDAAFLAAEQSLAEVEATAAHAAWCAENDRKRAIDTAEMARTDTP